MAISRRLRYEILRRDKHQCRYCGARAPEAELRVDHVTPKALGGTDDPSNLVASCELCNSGKAASAPDAPIVADVTENALVWARAMTSVIERRMAEHTVRRAQVDRFDTRWSAWGPVARDANWRDSVTRFLAMGLDEAFLADATETAMTRSRGSAWQYFCGICWRELAAVREMTAAAVAEPARDVLTEQCEPSGLMDWFDILLGDVLSATGVPEDAPAARIAHRALWEVIPDAARLYEQDHSGCDDPEDCRIAQEVDEFVSASDAPYMAAIKELVGSEVPV